MNLILLYGPPAVGKLTVAKVLQQKTGYKLFHNHMFLNPIVEIFGFDHPAQKKLEIEFYFRTIEEAVKADIDLIVTSGKAGEIRNEFFTKMISVVENNGGNCYLVHLNAPKDTLLQRLGNESRIQYHKLGMKKDFEAFYTAHPEILRTIPDRQHLHIDTSQLQPEQSAEKISNYYNLR